MAVDSSSEKRNRSNSLAPQEGSGNSSSEEFLESSLSAHSKPEDRLSRVVETVDGPTPQSSEKHLEKGQADLSQLQARPVPPPLPQMLLLHLSSPSSPLTFDPSPSPHVAHPSPLLASPWPPCPCVLSAKHSGRYHWTLALMSARSSIGAVSTNPTSPASVAPSPKI